ncbi:hypothetical protein EHP00_1923 [Ecytonucleospora hepatopenaei]|uniref:Uncharacterized protein n=1 Tax=Ecytonucleospora hepatopenaei TaxID=646526 RepID=A0A1W0E2I1_9MICR|nr:hypothetical protein EHP00_1923 [Ecytonucleospora hepatopenaei]
MLIIYNFLSILNAARWDGNPDENEENQDQPNPSTSTSLIRQIFSLKVPVTIADYNYYYALLTPDQVAEFKTEICNNALSTMDLDVKCHKIYCFLNKLIDKNWETTTLEFTKTLSKLLASSFIIGPTQDQTEKNKLKSCSNFLQYYCFLRENMDNSTRIKTNFIKKEIKKIISQNQEICTSILILLKLNLTDLKKRKSKNEADLNFYRNEIERLKGIESEKTKTISRLNILITSQIFLESIYEREMKEIFVLESAIGDFEISQNE